MEHLNEFRKHIPTRLIYLSFIVALFIELIPTRHWLPDVVGLLILYWIINTPEQVNLGTAFVLGIITDIATQSYLGQHALAYTMTSFLVLNNRRSIILHNYGWQSLVALGTLFGNQLIMGIIGFIRSHKIPSWDYIIPVFIGAALWPLLNKLIIFSYKSRAKR
ncbi:rod shape-determining protein MreD [Neisseria sp. Ec49-e6-T10]|uniref:rod shape-determining protein MreD n=1 Tax=Neisseria sp. Ec49-e6-T10 TaxID=3140744 RepID=UPI003EC0619F